jgi:NAD(P)-dependent dehydrogenase (short-subunit alcohol dehydrogenase family)
VRKLNNLVIGASSGIGEAVVKKIGGVAVARREEKLKQFEKYEVFDVTKLEEIEGFVKNCVNKYGKFDNLIYCAGIQNIKPLKVTKIDEIIQIFNTNLFAAMIFAKIFYSKKISNSSASMIFISSIASYKAESGILSYSASKAGLNSFIKGAAKELSPIRVNGIAPGFLQTEMTQKFKYIYNDEFIENLEKNSPAGLVDMEDIVKTIEFLINTKHITGEIITIDGGALL